MELHLSRNSAVPILYSPLTPVFSAGVFVCLSFFFATMNKKAQPKKNGRPRIELDEAQFETINQLCKIQCTGEEIASVIGMDYDTLAARIKEKYLLTFSEYIKRESKSGKASLRRAQWKSAMNGNATMQIWLGKQYLEQREPEKQIDDGQADTFEDMVFL
jgi:hypothetical protein